MGVEKRTGKDRRTGEERRIPDEQVEIDMEKRTGKDRRAGDDRRKKKRILVVEDTESLREILKELLEKDGYYDVEAVGDGQEAIHRVYENPPDLIILDIMLPKMDGFQVARLLKFNTKYQNIPIIMLTARSQEEAKELGKECGADAYLTKPYSDKELNAEIIRLLGDK